MNSRQNSRVISTPASLAHRDTDYGWKVCLQLLERTFQAIKNPELRIERIDNIAKLDKACVAAENYISTHNQKLNTTAIIRRKQLLKYQRLLVALLLKEKKSKENHERITFFTNAIKINCDLIAEADKKLASEIRTELGRWSRQLKDYKFDETKDSATHISTLLAADNKKSTPAIPPQPHLQSTSSISENSIADRGPSIPESGLIPDAKTPLLQGQLEEEPCCCIRYFCCCCISKKKSTPGLSSTPSKSQGPESPRMV